MKLRAIGGLFICGLGLVTSGCAQLHQVQIGEIHGDEGDLAPFEFKVSEMGLDIHGASAVTRSVMPRGDASKAVSSIENIIAMIQFGPKTGNAVYSDTYADTLALQLRTKCPSGKMTGLVSIRESRKYPVISGEIVKIKGYCIIPRKAGDRS